MCGAVTILGNAVSFCGRRTTSKAGVHVRGVFWIVRLDLVGARAAFSCGAGWASTSSDFFFDQCCARHNNCGSHVTVLN